MRTTLATFTIFSTLTLAGCGQKTESYTADYLQQHDDVRAKVLAECKDNKQTPENCATANAAESKVKLDNYNKQKYGNK